MFYTRTHQHHRTDSRTQHSEIHSPNRPGLAGRQHSASSSRLTGHTRHERACPCCCCCRDLQNKKSDQMCNTVRVRFEARHRTIYSFRHFHIRAHTRINAPLAIVMRLQRAHNHSVQCMHTCGARAHICHSVSCRRALEQALAQSTVSCSTRRGFCSNVIFNKPTTTWSPVSGQMSVCLCACFCVVCVSAHMLARHARHKCHVGMSDSHRNQAQQWSLFRARADRCGCACFTRLLIADPLVFANLNSNARARASLTHRNTQLARIDLKS